jgi:hypothetical protein
LRCFGNYPIEFFDKLVFCHFIGTSVYGPLRWKLKISVAGSKTA